MSKHTIFIIIAESYIVYWWLCLAYSRHKTALAKAAERAKYGVWDDAYNKALKDDMGQRYAMLEAVKAVSAGQPIVKLWDDTYNKAVKDGIRTYKAGMMASKAAREAAHK